MIDWHRVSPVQHHVFHAHPNIPSPSTPTLPRIQFSPRQLFPPTTPSPLRVQPVFLEEASPDMFPPTTPRAYILRVRNDLFPVLDSQSTISPSILNLPRARTPSEYNMLIVREIMDTSRHSQEQSPEIDWSDDGNDSELNRHMDAYEKEWYQDGDDDVLNHHMNVYEGCGEGLRKQ